jgi:heme/copper-type cytochrome/quinol oxidase subunit 3
MSKSESREWGRLTVRLVKPLVQTVDTNELESESRVVLTHLYLLSDLMILLVLLLIFSTLDSFVYTTWPNDFTSRTDTNK